MQRGTKVKTTTIASVLCLLVLFLAACGGGGSNKASSNLTPAPPDKQVLRQPQESGDFDTLDPALTTGGLGDPYNLMYSNLVALSDTGTLVDQLASSHQVSADGLKYTFTLRANLKFSDGTPLTATDVAYSLNRTVLPLTKSSVSDYLGLLKDYDQVVSGKIPTLIGDSILITGADTLSLIISKPAAYFLYALSYSTGDVVEKKLVDKYGEQWTDHLEEGGGSGPFKVQSYGHTTSLVLVPNSNYYDFTPKIQKIVYIIASDRNTNYKAFQANQYDLAPVPPALDDVAKAKPGFQLVPALASWFIGMNYLAKPLDNIKIRQALDLAINKDLIVGRIVGARVKPSNHIVPQGLPGYNTDLTGPAGVTSTAGDQTKAQQLFKEGLQEEGYTTASQLPSLSLDYNITNQTSADMMTAVTAEWKQVLGITIKPVGVQKNQLLHDEDSTVGHAGPVQMWYGSWASDYPDPQDWLTLFFGKGALHNVFNYGQNNSAAATHQQAVQAEMAQADGLQDLAARTSIYNETEQEIVNDVGWITTYQSAYVYSVNPKLQNWKLNALGSITTSDWANIYFAQ